MNGSLQDQTPTVTYTKKWGKNGAMGYEWCRRHCSTDNTSMEQRAWYVREYIVLCMNYNVL